MPNIFKKILPFFLILLLNACKKEEIDPLAITEANKIKGTWKLNKLELVGFNQEQKKAFGNDNSIFFDLIARSAMVPLNSQGSISLSGTFQIGNIFWNLRYEFDVTKKTFNQMTVTVTEEFYKNNVKYPEEYKITSELLEGEWDIKVIENTMTAQQVSNKRTPAARISFTATRQ